MGVFDRFRRTSRNLKDKAGDLADKHGDKAGETLDKMGEFVDERTRGKYSDRIDQGVEKSKEHIESLRKDEPGEGTKP